MSASNFNYFYPPPNSNTDYNNQHWNWGNDQYLQNYDRPQNFHAHSTNQGNNYAPQTSGFQNTQPFPKRFQRRGRFNNYSFSNGPHQNSLRTNYKRRLHSGDPLDNRSKAIKKKKKPLPPPVPYRKEWTIQEAEMALNIEKEYNKRFRNRTLIIKFPDLELNKEIVSKFHKAIANVHFQQPSTARFCFVTLQESADPDAVINTLNKQKFGSGYLTVEYKRDREDDQIIGPNDIDPLTLYVGNLAQEITREDMKKIFPKCTKIDDGYAQRMKYTRYAFVTFNNVSDALEAFKKTHSREMYSKSVIVKFRRWHGTVGMPGESKPQNPPKSRNDEQDTSSIGEANTSLAVAEYNDELQSQENNSTNSSCTTSIPSLISEPSVENIIEDPSVKTESSNLDDKKHDPNYESPFVPGPLNSRFVRHRPKIKTETKIEVKEESEPNNETDKIFCSDYVDITSDTEINIKLEKSELEQDISALDKLDFDTNYSGDIYSANVYSGSEDEDDDILERAADFDQLYRDITNRTNLLNSLKKV